MDAVAGTCRVEVFGEWEVVDLIAGGTEGIDVAPVAVLVGVAVAAHVEVVGVVGQQDGKGERQRVYRHHGAGALREPAHAVFDAPLRGVAWLRPVNLGGESQDVGDLHVERYITSGCLSDGQVVDFQIPCRAARSAEGNMGSEVGIMEERIDDFFITVGGIRMYDIQR